METTSTLYDLFTAHPRVVTDSRHIVPGAIFFALRGATFDGNAFAAAALAAGAAAAGAAGERAVAGGGGPRGGRGTGKGAGYR